MTRSSFLLSLVLSGFLAFCQSTTQTKPSSTAPTPSLQPSAPPVQTSPSTNSSGLRPRGPEAVAAQDPNRPVATIGGTKVTAKQAVDMLKAVSSQDRKRLEGNLQSVVQQLYMQEQLSSEATKLNLDQQEPTKTQLQTARMQVLTQAYLAKLADQQPGANQDPKQYYDAHPSEYEQAKLEGILVGFSPPGTPASSGANVRTEAQAREKADDLEKKIKSGTDFAALARTDSEDAKSAPKGGDLGEVPIGNPGVPADIKTAVEKLQPGQVSDPIKVQSGFYILKLIAKTTVPFDQVRATIAEKLQNDRRQAVVKAQLDKYKIEVQDPDFFASGPPIPSLAKPAASTPPPAKP